MSGVRPAGEIHALQFTPTAERSIHLRVFQGTWQKKVCRAGGWGMSYRTGLKPRIQETEIKRSKRKKFIVAV